MPSVKNLGRSVLLFVTGPKKETELLHHRRESDGIWHMPFLKRVESTVKEIPWLASRSIAGLIKPESVAFYRKVTSGGYEPEKFIIVLRSHKLIYIAIPKSASTRIRRTLARIAGQRSRSLGQGRRSKYRGPYALRNIAIGTFHELATDPATLRFSFVRNPYARAVSCWADKFASKPLVGGDPFVDAYLALRPQIDSNLPEGANHSLSFADFTIFVTAAATAYKDGHIQPQFDILSIPGIELDFIGKVESFSADFARVLDHLKASDDVRRQASAPVNESHHLDWPTYYTAELADRIYRRYESDFDRFGYPRALTSRKVR